MLSDTAASLEPPLTFKMAQELTFTMLAHTLLSTGGTRDRSVDDSYVTIPLTFLQTVLRHPEGLATLEHAITIWLDLAAFHLSLPHFRLSFLSHFPLPLLPSSRLPLGRTDFSFTTQPTTRVRRLSHVALP